MCGNRWLGGCVDIACYARMSMTHTFPLEQNILYITSGAILAQDSIQGRNLATWMNLLGEHLVAVLPAEGKSSPPIDSWALVLALGVLVSLVASTLGCFADWACKPRSGISTTLRLPSGAFVSPHYGRAHHRG